MLFNSRLSIMRRWPLHKARGWCRAVFRFEGKPRLKCMFLGLSCHDMRSDWQRKRGHPSSRPLRNMTQCGLFQIDFLPFDTFYKSHLTFSKRNPHFFFASFHHHRRSDLQNCDTVINFSSRSLIWRVTHYVVCGELQFRAVDPLTSFDIHYCISTSGFIAKIFSDLESPHKAFNLTCDLICFRANMFWTILLLSTRLLWYFQVKKMCFGAIVTSYRVIPTE